jgi:hypothetical protein
MDILQQRNNDNINEVAETLLQQHGMIHPSLSSLFLSLTHRHTQIGWCLKTPKRYFNNLA